MMTTRKRKSSTDIAGPSTKKKICSSLIRKTEDSSENHKRRGGNTLSVNVTRMDKVKKKKLSIDKVEKKKPSIDKVKKKKPSIDKVKKKKPNIDKVKKKKPSIDKVKKKKPNIDKVKKKNPSIDKVAQKKPNIDKVEKKKPSTDKVKKKKPSIDKVKKKKPSIDKVKKKNPSIAVNKGNRKYQDGKVIPSKTNKSCNVSTWNTTPTRKAPKTVRTKTNTSLTEIDESAKMIPQIQVIQTLNTRLICLVSHVISLDENTMWIGRQAYDSFMKVCYSSGIIEIIKEFPHPEHDFSDLCYDPFTNEILYCDRVNCCIMSVMEDFQLRKFRCVKPMKPACIAVSPDNHIYIGLIDNYDYIASPRREIVKISRDGNICLRIKGLDKKVIRFALPHRVVINPVNNNIVVASGHYIKSRLCGHVVNFDFEGNLTFIYKGQKTDKDFTVIGLTCSQKGNIICADDTSGDIHILDAMGRLLNRVSMSFLGISGKPWSLSMDKQGHLMIGAMMGAHGALTKGVIYITEYTEQYSESDGGNKLTDVK